MANNYKCFFISPIGEPGSPERENSDLVMEELLIPALVECGFNQDNIKRSDQLHDPNIHEEMNNRLENDEICVADITGYNSNVMYELGYRHGLKKPIILLQKKCNTTKN